MAEHLADAKAPWLPELRDFLDAVAAEYERADAVHESLERLALAARAAEDGVYDWRLDTGQAHFSARYCSMLGLEPEALKTVDAWQALVHPDDLAELRRRFSDHIDGTLDSFEAEYRLRHAEGDYRWVLSRGVTSRDAAGIAVRVTGTLSDITARKDVENHLTRYAYHDESTGYPNRHLLLERLRRSIARGDSFSLAAICIDAFDKIADSFSHELCEDAVTAIADRIAQLGSPLDTLARIRKDQLCLMSESAPDLSSMLQLTDRLLDAVQKPIQVQGEEVFTSLSIGLVSSDADARPAEGYVHDAVVAMNRAADAGGGRHAVFDLQMHQKTVQKLQLEKELRRAIAHSEMIVYYQPIISLQTGSIAGFEALLRWNHPERGVLAPAEFIDVAEEGGHLSAIFDQVLPKILKRVELWQARARDGKHPFVNVNLSRTQFRDPDLLLRIDRALDGARLAPFTVGFEMTESVMVESQEVIETLRQLKKRRVRLLLDDFGTGYSCLSNLRQFPLDSIKIDKSFVAGVGKSPQGGEIARAITNLSHSMAMDVTIEGIETEAQLRFAYNLGCEHAQGYHFAKPLPEDQAGKLLEQRYRTSLTPPSSGKRPRNPERRGRVLVIDHHAERQRVLGVTLEEDNLEVVQAFTGHDGLLKADADLPDVILVAMDLPEMGSVELCRMLGGEAETSSIPILLLASETTPNEAVTECLDLGATDCVFPHALETSSQPVRTRILLARISAAMTLSHAHRKLRAMAMTDEQTGVFTRRFLIQALRRSVKATVRTAQRGLACLVVDVDDFRTINQIRGHIEADAMLQTIASTVDRTTRETDLVGRFGGAEFVVLLQDTNQVGARSVAEKIRAAVESTCDATVSIGGAILRDASVDKLRTVRAIDELISQLLRDADKAKYQAKSLGKNRVAFIDDPASQTG